MIPIFVSWRRPRYGFFNFLLDLGLTIVTGGLWLIWILVRWLANRNRERVAVYWR